MSIPERRARTRSPEDRRQQLLDAAVGVFVEKGYAHSTVADVTEAAGVAKGTFYLYFDSKEHLLAALRERFVEETLAHTATLYARVGVGDWWALVDVTVESMIDFMLERREMLKILAQEGTPAHTQDLLAECEQKINAMFASGIRAGIDAGVFQVRDPTLAAVFLHYAVEGAVLESLLFRKDFDRDRLVAASKELAHKLLRP